ncbi:hypothetical protein F4801DRAFT_301255 [Xylaria longipes]|nr:hypothetical protein F4801DRAFT_301255 [Xylaria longipes]
MQANKRRVSFKLLTAISQSVGASDLALHLTSFKGERGVPFQQAIMMSGAGGQNFNTLSDVVANNTAAIADKVGCVIAGDSQSLRTLQCLREAPVDVLTNLSVTASWAARPPFGEAFFFPTYDGDIVPGSAPHSTFPFNGFGDRHYDWSASSPRLNDQSPPR